MIARLETNEWGGTVEPRLVLSSLHVVPGEPAGSDETPGKAGCAGCGCRARGEWWWDAVWSELDADPRSGREVALEESRTIVDSRGRGILGSLSDLLSTRESLAVTCADVSRRLELLDCELDPTRFGRGPAITFSARCAGNASERAADAARDGFLLLDYPTLDREPALLSRFTHVFALDPPPFQRFQASLRHAAIDPAFLHLGWGAAELEFTRMMVEQEYGLRAPLAAVYRALSKQGPISSGPALEVALCGESRHPRSPLLVGRCLRVLVELGLVELERSSATVKCAIIEQRKVELERSRAFLAYAALHEQAQRCLSEPQQPTSRAKAA
jgi:hypothetical protein